MHGLFFSIENLSDIISWNLTALESCRLSFCWGLSWSLPTTKCCIQLYCCLTLRIKEQQRNTPEEHQFQRSSSYNLGMIEGYWKWLQWLHPNCCWNFSHEDFAVNVKLNMSTEQNLPIHHHQQSQTLSTHLRGEPMLGRFEVQRITLEVSVWRIIPQPCGGVDPIYTNTIQHSICCQFLVILIPKFWTQWECITI